MVGILSLYPPCLKMSDTVAYSGTLFHTHEHLTQSFEVDEAFPQPDVTPDGLLHPERKWAEIFPININGCDLVLHGATLPSPQSARFLPYFIDG